MEARKDVNMEFCMLSCYCSEKALITSIFFFFVSSNSSLVEQHLSLAANALSAYCVAKSVLATKFKK